MSGPSIRLYMSAPVTTGEMLVLPEGPSHYLQNVMRLAVGARLRVFHGAEFEAEISGTSKKRQVTLTVLRQTRAPEPEPDVWLCFALLKRQKTDLVVEKATELGVSVIQPIMTARTNADHVNLERLSAIATEAAEQCERLTVPAIRAPVSLAALMAAWPARPLFVADERRTAGLLAPVGGPCALMTGPEGGFTDSELEAIASQPLVTRVSLGRRILRAETAVIAGLALMLCAEE